MAMLLLLLVHVVYQLAAVLSTPNVGGLIAIQTEDEEATKDAKFAVIHLNRLSSSKYAFVLTQKKVRAYSSRDSL